MAGNSDVWVFSEKRDLLAELMAAGALLASASQCGLAAVVLGPRSSVDEAARRGAGKVFWLGDQKADVLVEDYVPTLARLVEQNQPSALLVGSTRRGRAVAGRLAARAGVTAITDVTQFLLDGGRRQARHMIFGGGAERVESPLTALMLATVGPGLFEALPAVDGRQAEVVEVSFVEPGWRIGRREVRPRPVASVNLAAAKRVVCAGRGLAKQEDLSLVNELAEALAAEVACTRPLAEGQDWLPRERYIGISGATIRPDLYLGVGVSGQVQHIVGMSESRLVVAINKDQNAPIFEQADYGIVGDLYAVVPALIKALKARKKP
jgi:electron transfer flavoprotein alpha subunit